MPHQESSATAFTITETLLALLLVNDTSQLGQRAEIRQPEKPDSFYAAQKISGAAASGIVGDGMYNNSNAGVY